MLLRAALLTATLAILAPARSEALTLYFYSKNDCRGDVKRSILANGLRGVQRHKLGPQNDEYRSMKIVTTLPEVADMSGPVIQLYDDPQGRLFHDDEAWITILDVRKIPPGGECIRSFEQSRSDHILVEYFRKNGLDGKVSLIETICHETCRGYFYPPGQEPPGQPAQKKRLELPDHIRNMEAELRRHRIPR